MLGLISQGRAQTFARKLFNFFVILGLIMCFYACSNAEGELTQLIKRSLRGDATITANEWSQLENLVKGNDGLSIYEAKNELCTLIDEIGKELSQSERNPLPYPPTVSACAATLTAQVDTFNVYLENSASMDGYMNGLTEFKEVLYHILTELKGNDVGIKFAFINKETYDFDTQEINEFIEFLQPSNMRGMGSRGDTELNHIIRNVLAQQKDDGHPIILISDYIFSVKDMHSVDGDLPKAKYTLKTEVQKLDSKDNAILVMQYFSNFAGNYYDYKNARSTINALRPYYIWVIGSLDTVKDFMEDYYITQAKGFQEYFVIANDNAFDSPYYAVLGSTKRKGRFQKCRGQSIKGCIEGIRFIERGESEGELQFAVAVDLSDMPVADSYKMETNNYLIEAIKSDELKIVEVLKISDIEANDERYQGSATHILVLKTTKASLSQQDQQIKIKLRNRIPEWVYKSSTLDDTEIKSDASLLPKTFGFEYLATGAFEALNSPALDKCFFWEIPVRINNEQ